tara:strand:+ start:1869 stop:3221 length:1353 start_codon:yes stop_codon:yes gene_type:complete
MSRITKNKKRINPRYFLNETTTRDSNENKPVNEIFGLGKKSEKSESEPPAEQQSADGKTGLSAKSAAFRNLEVKGVTINITMDRSHVHSRTYSWEYQHSAEIRTNIGVFMIQPPPLKADGHELDSDIRVDMLVYQSLRAFNSDPKSLFSTPNLARAATSKMDEMMKSICCSTFGGNYEGVTQESSNSWKALSVRDMAAVIQAKLGSSEIIPRMNVESFQQKGAKWGWATVEWDTKALSEVARESWAELQETSQKMDNNMFQRAAYEEEEYAKALQQRAEEGDDFFESKQPTTKTLMEGFKRFLNEEYQQGERPPMHKHLGRKPGEYDALKAKQQSPDMFSMSDEDEAYVSDMDALKNMKFNKSNAVEFSNILSQEVEKIVDGSGTSAKLAARRIYDRFKGSDEREMLGYLDKIVADANMSEIPRAKRSEVQKFMKELPAAIEQQMTTEEF